MLVAVEGRVRAAEDEIVGVAAPRERRSDADGDALIVVDKIRNAPMPRMKIRATWESATFWFPSSRPGRDRLKAMR